MVRRAEQNYYTAIIYRFSRESNSNARHVPDISLLFPQQQLLVLHFISKINAWNHMIIVALHVFYVVQYSTYYII